MGSKRYVAWLRGINVGGRNPVPMTELRATFEAAGFGGVSTYIQSGNVLFGSDADTGSLEGTIERALEERFRVPLVVVVRSHGELRKVVAKAPDGFGDPETHHRDAIFLKAPLTSKQAMKVVVEREGVDRAWPGTGVLYFSRVSALRTKSRMSSIMGTPEYQSMTIRSWNTTTKVLALLDASAD